MEHVYWDQVGACRQAGHLCKGRGPPGWLEVKDEGRCCSSMPSCSRCDWSSGTDADAFLMATAKASTAPRVRAASTASATGPGGGLGSSISADPCRVPAAHPVASKQPQPHTLFALVPWFGRSCSKSMALGYAIWVCSHCDNGGCRRMQHN